MAAGSIDLGALEVENAAAGLQLSLSSSAHFLASSQTDFAPLAERLTTAALNPGSTDRPAISYESEIRLLIDFSYEAEFCQATRDGLYQAAALRLKHAELWRKLQLDVVAVDCSIDGSAACLAITLSRSQDIAIPSARCGHKLRSVGAHFRAAIPHNAGLLQLDHMGLKVRIVRKPTGARHDSYPLHLVPKKPKLPENIQGGRSPTMIKYASSPSRRIVTAPNYMAPPNNPAGHSDFSPLEQTSGSGRSSLTKRSFSTNDLRLSGQEFDLDTAVLDLFDAGFLLAISSNTRQLGRDIRVVESSSFKSLASIIPELWSPGYSTAVSTRSLFLPTISHAMSHVCGAHARNSVLETKMNELCRREAMQPHSPNASCGPIYANQQALLANRLWQVTQQSMYDTKAAKMLRTTSDACSQHDNERCEDLHDFSDSGSILGDMVDCDDVTSFLDYNDHDEVFVDLDDIPPDMQVQVAGLEGGREPMERRERRLHVDLEDDILSVCGSVESLVILEEVDAPDRREMAGYTEGPVTGVVVPNRTEDLDMDEMLEVY